MSNEPSESDGDREAGGELRSGLVAMVSIKADHDLDAFDGNDLIESLKARLRETLGTVRMEVSLTPEGDAHGESSAALLRGELRLDLSAAVDGETLEETLTAVLEAEIAVARGLLFRIARLERVAPGQDEPTHPMTATPT